MLRFSNGPRPVSDRCPDFWTSKAARARAVVKRLDFSRSRQLLRCDPVTAAHGVDDIDQGAVGLVPLPDGVQRPVRKVVTAENQAGAIPVMEHSIPGPSDPLRHESLIGPSRPWPLFGEHGESPFGGEPGDKIHAGIGPVAASGMVLQSSRHSRPDGVDGGHSVQVQAGRSRVQQKCLESALKEVAAAILRVIDPFGVAEVELLQDPRKRDVRHLNDQVKVVGHETESVDSTTEFFNGLLKEEGKMTTVPVLEEDGGAGIAAQDDMVDGAWEMDAGFSWYGGRYGGMAESQAWYQGPRLTLLGPDDLVLLCAKLVARG